MTALTDAEYVLSSVALGIDEYYAGVGEAPGVWAGGWSRSLRLEGVVEAEDLRSLIDGMRPGTDEPLLAGSKPRSVKAFDLTFSAPKSVSLLWALGTDQVADITMTAHREAVSVALGFLEERAATARQQVDGLRRHVPTNGWAVAAFAHRTSREGDPQIHTHCVVPNLVQRSTDGRHVALAARPLFVWARAAGSIYQAVLQHELSTGLGVEWEPDKNNTREMAGFTREQLRAFSKRTLQVEAELEARGARYESGALRQRADDEASLATRGRKDHRATPTMLRGRWEGEAAEIDLAVEDGLDAMVCGRRRAPESWSYGELVSALVDAEHGVCAHAPRFSEPDVVEHVAALSAGRLTDTDITEVVARFLASDLVVPLTPPPASSGWQPQRWSTRAHRDLEDATLGLLEKLVDRPVDPINARPTDSEGDGGVELGDDQARAIKVLCGSGGSVRAVLAPAGYGKTAMAHAAARAASDDGRPLVAVATTGKAVAELVEAGLPAKTIASFRLDLATSGLAAGTVVVLDEVSQTSTVDGHAVLEAIAACPASQLWVLGDPRQAPSVQAGGIAAEIERLADTGTIPAARLLVNRRQTDADDRRALALLRAGDAHGSQAKRNEHGWEHQAANPGRLREAMADAVAADLLAGGPGSTAALVVSHGQAEDLADRIRERLTTAGWLGGPILTGPGWTVDRHYQAGDRILCHTRHGSLVNGSVITIEAVTSDAVTGRLDNGREVVLDRAFATGTRADGSPNVSHAWARTVDGAQGGTWDHAHLLGTPALDAYRGYTGQSRSRAPTHTWNTLPLVELDVGGQPHDRGEPADQVAAALARTPDVTFAAVDDPWHLDGQLRTEIAAHKATLAARPPDRSAALDAARAWHQATQADLSAALTEVAGIEHRLDHIGRIARVTPKGRAERDRLDAALEQAHGRASVASGEVARSSERVERFEGEEAVRAGFDRREGWRHDALARCEQRLGQHWTEVAVACVVADQPLAFGVEVLRHAHHDLGRRLDTLDGNNGGRLSDGLERDRLAEQLHLVVTALHRTRVDRVLGLLTDPTTWHAEVLGPPPPRPAGRALWCDGAYRLEEHLDRASSDPTAWEMLCHEVGALSSLCDIVDDYLAVPETGRTPQSWARVAFEIEDRLETLTAAVDVGRSFGIELGDD